MSELENKPSPRKLWYLVHLVLGGLAIISGLVVYFLWKDRNAKAARRHLMVGVVISVLGVVFVGSLGLFSGGGSDETELTSGPEVDLADFRADNPGCTEWMKVSGEWTCQMPKQEPQPQKQELQTSGTVPCYGNACPEPYVEPQTMPQKQEPQPQREHLQKQKQETQEKMDDVIGTSTVKRHPVNDGEYVIRTVVDDEYVTSTINNEIGRFEVTHPKAWEMDEPFDETNGGTFSFEIFNEYVYDLSDGYSLISYGFYHSSPGTVIEDSFLNEWNAKGFLHNVLGVQITETRNDGFYHLIGTNEHESMAFVIEDMGDYYVVTDYRGPDVSEFVDIHGTFTVVDSGSADHSRVNHLTLFAEEFGRSSEIQNDELVTFTMDTTFGDFDAKIPNGWMPQRVGQDEYRISNVGDGSTFNISFLDPDFYYYDFDQDTLRMMVLMAKEFHPSNEVKIDTQLESDFVAASAIDVDTGYTVLGMLKDRGDFYLLTNYQGSAEAMVEAVHDELEDSISHISNEPETTPSNGMVGGNPLVSPLPDQASASNADAEVQFAVGSIDPACANTDECFIPSEVTVDVGGEVTWTNVDNVFHTIAAGDLSEDPSMIGADYPNGFGDAGTLIQPGETFTHKFEVEGTYPYVCTIHPWMAGTVVVSG